MTRRPLRPLASVIHARETGGDPDAIEARERARRNQKTMIRQRKRAENRLLMLGCCFFAAFALVGTRMAILANSKPAEPVGVASRTEIISQRADILDRNGAVLATNLTTQSLYAQPHMMVDPARAADEILKIFPDLDPERTKRDFTSGKRKFIWIKRKISPEQRQMVHDLGEPGLLFGPREMRLYPNGKLAAHVLGGTSFGKEAVNSAEIIGMAGIEKFHDDTLRDPALNLTPLQLSIDLTAQATTRRVLEGGMKLMGAKGASAVLMKAKTGEIVSLVSLPDFDPNDRPLPRVQGDQSLDPLFNRAAQGSYELGSTFKLFTAAMALERGIANPATPINTETPLKVDKFKIRDFKNYGPRLSLTDVIVKSSNTGTARLAMQMGAQAQKDVLKKLGFFEKLPVEIAEASQSKPILPETWREANTATISYGHGIAASPVHLAAAYATMVGDGTVITPTLLKRSSKMPKGERVFSEKTAKQIRTMLRAVVAEGTASLGEVPGYLVGGKTGTADKPKPTGGYYEDKVIATFAAIFPSNDPEYVLVVSLDEPEIEAYGEERRTAGWTAVPVTAEIISRVAPVLNLRPQVEEQAKVTYTSSQ